MKKVCVSMFLIILLVAIVPVSADAVEHERWVELG